MFGALPIEPQYLLTQLIARVRVHTTETPWRRNENTAYTDAVKETLKALAEECSLRQKCFYTKAEPDMKEFLLDIVWLGDRGASLACECEWLYDRFPDEQRYAEAVGEDFEKLLYFKAPFKLMIFATPQESATLRGLVIAEINRYLSGYGHHIEGEVYLALDFAPVSKAWIATNKAGDSRPVLEDFPI